MRIGNNPEKAKSIKLQYKLHRVIIPVYIPNEDNEYFKNLDAVFFANLNSLLKTIDPNQTNITILNNNSKKEVSDFIDNLLLTKQIDKHVKFSENYGKVYAILQEARASYEEFITIADADVFFFNDWQNQVHNVFTQFKKVGVVGLTPDPNMAFYCNNSLFFDKPFTIKKGKIVADYDLELFEEGINNPNLFQSKNKNWKAEQFYIEKNQTKVVVGSNHFASTYRKEVFNKMKFQKPLFVFPGGERTFLDIPIDELGYYRVSLTRAFAYHMGNLVKEELKTYQSSNATFNSVVNQYEKKTNAPFSIRYKIKELVARTVRKLRF